MPRQTTFTKTGEHKAAWRHVDADGQVLGRLATQIAQTLMGKHRPTYTPHVDTGDFVIVTNVEKLVLTGSKAADKVHATYSRYPGGRRTETYESLLKRRPGKVLEIAVARMLPKSKLGKQMAGKLRIYTGPDHPHQAQQPEPLA